jgi:tyrosine-protein phosphatase YwqE
MNELLNLFETILTHCGYCPVTLAHPERYTYFAGALPKWKAFAPRPRRAAAGELNLAGYYSSAAKKVAEQLVDATGLVDLGAPTLHHLRHTGTPGNWRRRRNRTWKTTSVSLC